MLFAIAGWLNQDQRQKIEFLQQQVRVLQELNGQRRLRFTNAMTSGAGSRYKAHDVGGRSCESSGRSSHPRTILRRHRELIARTYDGSGKRRPGRPRVVDEFRALVLRMATEKEGWGDSRIVGSLSKLGAVTSRSSLYVHPQVVNFFPSNS